MAFMARRTKKNKEFWQSSENDQPKGACLVTDGEQIQYAVFDGEKYLGTTIKQSNIIAWFPCLHPPMPLALMTPEQHAILQLEQKTRSLEEKLSSIKQDLIRIACNRERADDKKSKVL